MSAFTSRMQTDGIRALVNRLGFQVVRIEDRGALPGGTEYAGKAIVTLFGKPTYGQVFDAIYRHREEWPDAWSVLPDAALLAPVDG